MTFGRQISVEETLDSIAAVRLDEIHSLASEHFQTDKVAFAAIGDLQGLTFEREAFEIS
jgi:hypothetical protein